MCIRDSPRRTGYTFAGWYKEAECKNAFDFDNELITADVTIYAKWEMNEYKIEFKDNNKILNIDPIKFTIEDYNNNIVIDLSKYKADKIGYNFEGWVDVDNKIVNKIEIKNLNNIEIDAKWSLINYKIIFDLGFSDDEIKYVTNPNNIDYYTIETDTIVLQDLKRDGYKFLGWYMKSNNNVETASLAAVVENEEEIENYGEKVTEIKKGSYGDVTLTALWEKVEAEAAENTTTTDTTATETAKTDESNDAVNESVKEEASTADTSNAKPDEASLSQTGDNLFKFAVVAFVIAVAAGGILVLCKLKRH